MFLVVTLALGAFSKIPGALATLHSLTLVFQN